MTRVAAGEPALAVGPSDGPPGPEATPPAPPLPAALERAVREYLAHLTVERGLSPNTVAAYRRDLARYAAYLAARGRTEPADVTPADVAEYVTTVRTGADGAALLSPSSTARSVA